jgi:putative methyltransferase
MGSMEGFGCTLMAAFPGWSALTAYVLWTQVYSTCSVHERENEAVVAAVLPDAERLGFILVDPFPQWHRRGLPGSIAEAEKLVRTDPLKDQTDGFFLAVFQRKECDADA